VRSPLPAPRAYNYRAVGVSPISFASSREAKEFLVSRIVEEASRRRVRLSELERKMLYFSEAYPTLPDMMEVSEKFEAEHDSEKYEAKIRELSRNAFQRDRMESPENVPLWREAIKVLNKEDHYILVMLDVPRSAGGFAKGSPSDRAKLVISGLVLAALALGGFAAIQWAEQNVHFKIPDNIKLPAFILVLAVAYYLLYSEKWKKVGAYLTDVAKRVARWFLDQRT
jgi:hypothetical protein